MGYSKKDYTPKQGDIVKMNVSPSIGKEIYKVRPAVVMSIYEYNFTTGFCVVCPITHGENKRFISLENYKKTTGNINPMQIKGFDFTNDKRSFSFVEKLRDEDFGVVAQRVSAIFKFEDIFTG